VRVLQQCRRPDHGRPPVQMLVLIKSKCNLSPCRHIKTLRASAHR
jgi:hypothetical protein